MYVWATFNLASFRGFLWELSCGRVMEHKINPSANLFGQISLISSNLLRLLSTTLMTFNWWRWRGVSPPSPPIKFRKIKWQVLPILLNPMFAEHRKYLILSLWRQIVKTLIGNMYVLLESIYKKQTTKALLLLKYAHIFVEKGLLRCDFSIFGSKSKKL